MTDCPQCQAPLPADAPGGDCPRCLLGIGLQSLASLPRAGGFRAPTVDELRPLFPAFEVLELLGQGGMGAVYRARQLKLDREVALKILPAELARDDTFSERFAREARAIAKLNHPGVVGIHDFGEAGPYHYLVLELVEGTTLRELAAGERLGVEETLRLLRELCAAVAYAHKQDVIHRDLKPENVLVDSEGRVRVVDFGLAKVTDAARHSLLPSLTGTRVAVGTPHYMAPEQLEGVGEVGTRADVYSLGVIAYELLTGRLPLGRFPAPSEEVEGLDASLDELVLQALDRDPARRPGSVQELLDRLERAAAATPRKPPRRRGGGSAPSRTPPTADGGEAVPRLLWVLLGLGMLVLLSTFMEWATIPFDRHFGAASFTITAWGGTQTSWGLSVPTWLIAIYALALCLGVGSRLAGKIRTHAGVLAVLVGLGLLQSAHFVAVLSAASEGSLGAGAVFALLSQLAAAPAVLALLALDGGWRFRRPQRAVAPASKSYSRGLSRLNGPSREWSAEQVRTEARGRAIMNRGRRRREPGAEKGAEDPAGDD